jgi:exopolysaccharide production protein ExoQ
VLWTPAWPAVRPGLTAATVFVMFGCLLFILQLGSLGPAAGLGLAGVLAFMNRQALPGLFGARSFLFLVPLLCMASALWSEDRFASFRSGVEMTATIAAGIVLSLADRKKEVLAGVAGAFAVYNATALALGHYVDVGTAEQAFSGLNAGKNFMAELASTGILAALGFALAAAGERRLIWRLGAAAAIAAAAVEVYVLVLARSAGALIALGVGITALGLLAGVSRLGAVWRRAAVAGAGLSIAALAIFQEPAARFVSDTALKAFGKDPTLTGRTYLWYRAKQMIAEKPLFGHGFDAFWRQGNPDAEGLWRFAGIEGRTGFNFHNTGVELLVQFGWIGTFMVAAVVLAGTVLLVRRFVLKPDAMTCFWLALIAFELVRTFYETIGPTPFYFSNILLAAAFASSFRTPELVEAPRDFQGEVFTVRPPESLST